MDKLTRLATTVTARYYPSSDLTDAFFLDGRISGRREARAADITVDKEERGFFFSVFSHASAPGREPQATPAYEAPLRKFLDEIKLGKKALDDEIGEFVNTSVAVTGRMRLSAENARTPFFAGIVIKDSEAFAITMGKGLAFLYRDDTLFPLTATDLPMEPVNTQKQKVDNFYNYCASKTATALYSNIAQLKMDDCIILCNREVYEALGQHELLRILYDAEDQADAASMAITEAAAKLPGVPLQFLISFVESVTTQDKPGFFGFGRKGRQRSYDDMEDEAIEVPVAKPSYAPPPAVPTIGMQGGFAPPTPAQEPLYFGNESSDPYVHPLAEQPVAPVTAEDPIHFQDDQLDVPFGEPSSQTEPAVDDGGFVIPEPVVPLHEPSYTQKVTDNYQVDSTSEDHSTYSSPKTDDHNNGADDSHFQSAFRYIPETEDESTSDETLFFGDETEENSDSAVSDASQTHEEQPIFTPFSPDSPPTDDYYAHSSLDSKPVGDSSYIIPFEATEATVPVSTHIDDIPDMPIYDAPTYSPPTYPANSYTPKGYDNAGVYARGSYSLDNEDQDVRQDIPPHPTSSEKGYTYAPPQQTVPSYGSEQYPDFPDYPRASHTPPPRDGFSGGNTGRQLPPHGKPRPGTPPSAHRNTARRPPQDVFDQEQDFDYGETDTAYNRNKMLMLALAAICVICLAALIYFAVSNNKKSAKPTTPTTAQSISVTDPSATDTASGGQETQAPTTPPGQGGAPADAVAIFAFSDEIGFRTWWDLFNTAYNVQLDSDTDPRINQIIQYNALPAGYTPKAGDRLYLPPVGSLTAPATTTTTTTTTTAAT